MAKEKAMRCDGAFEAREAYLRRLEQDVSIELQCEHCDNPARHSGLCTACIADDMDYDPVVDDRDAEGPSFECAGYYPEPAGEFYCPLWGTEECDWECPHS